LMVTWETAVIKPGQLISLMVMSGTIGVISMIFESGRLPFIGELILHIGLVFVLVWIMYKLNQFQIHHFLITFGVVYVFAWLLVYIMQKMSVKEINSAIQRRKTQK